MSIVGQQAWCKGCRSFKFRLPLYHSAAVSLLDSTVKGSGLSSGMCERVWMNAGGCICSFKSKVKEKLPLGYSKWLFLYIKRFEVKELLSGSRGWLLSFLLKLREIKY